MWSLCNIGKKERRPCSVIPTYMYVTLGRKSVPYVLSLEFRLRRKNIYPRLFLSNVAGIDTCS